MMFMILNRPAKHLEVSANLEQLRDIYFKFTQTLKNHIYKIFIILVALLFGFSTLVQAQNDKCSKILKVFQMTEYNNEEEKQRFCNIILGLEFSVFKEIQFKCSCSTKKSLIEINNCLEKEVCRPSSDSGNASLYGWDAQKMADRCSSPRSSYALLGPDGSIRIKRAEVTMVVFASYLIDPILWRDLIPIPILALIVSWTLTFIVFKNR